MGTIRLAAKALRWNVRVGIGDHVRCRVAAFANEGAFFLSSARTAAPVPEGILPARKAERAFNATDPINETEVCTLSIGPAANRCSADPIPPRSSFLLPSAGC